MLATLTRKSRTGTPTVKPLDDFPALIEATAKLQQLKNEMAGVTEKNMTLTRERNKPRTVTAAEVDAKLAGEPAPATTDLDDELTKLVHESEVVRLAIARQQDAVEAEANAAREAHRTEWQSLLRAEVAALDSIVIAIEARRSFERSLRRFGGRGISPFPDLSLPDALFGQIKSRSLTFASVAEKHLK